MSGNIYKLLFLNQTLIDIGEKLDIDFETKFRKLSDIKKISASVKESTSLKIRRQTVKGEDRKPRKKVAKQRSQLSL